MNVQMEALRAVILMQLATTLKGVTAALATLDTRAMGSIAQVCIQIFNVTLSSQEVSPKMLQLNYQRI